VPVYAQVQFSPLWSMCTEDEEKRWDSWAARTQEGQQDGDSQLGHLRQLGRELGGVEGKARR
jgi:hypothetical protein